MITLLIYALALLVRLPGLFAPMWYDEVFSWWVRQLPPQKMAAAILGDVHPPLFYYLLPAGEPWLMRLVPLVFSMLGLWATMRLACWMFPGKSRAIWAVGLLYALSPFEVFYATELRMYAALQFFVLMMLWYMLHREYGKAAGFGMAAAMFHHFGLVYVAAFAVCSFLWEFAFGEDHDPVFSGLAVTPMALPFLVTLTNGFWSQQAAVGAGYWLWRPSVADFALLWGEFMFGAPSGNPGITALVIVLGVLALGLVMWHMLRDARPLAVWMMAPVVLAFFISWIFRPVFMARPLIAIAPMFYVTLVAAIAALGRREKWIVAVLAAPVLVGALVLPNTRAQYLSRINVREVAQAVGTLPANAVIYETALYPRIELEQVWPDARHIIPPQPGGLGDGYSPQTRAALGIEEWSLDALPTQPDVVVIYDGYFVDGNVMTAARHLVAQQAYRLVYHHGDGKEPQISVFVRRP